MAIGVAIAGGLTGLLAGGQSAMKGFVVATQTAQQLTIQGAKAVNQSFVEVSNQARQSAGLGSMFSGVLQILVTTIGTLLTPVIVVVAAALLTLADILMRYVIPALRAMFTPEGREEVAKGVIDAIMGWLHDKFGIGGGAMDFAKGGGEGAIARKDKAEGVDAPGLIDIFFKAMEDITKEMRIGMGRQGQVGFSSIADVWKQVQMKAFLSPFEQRNLDLLTKQINLAQETLGALRQAFGKQGARKVGQMGMKEFAENFGGAM